MQTYSDDRAGASLTDPSSTSVKLISAGARVDDAETLKLSVGCVETSTYWRYESFTGCSDIAIGTSLKWRNQQ